MDSIFFKYTTKANVHKVAIC